MFNQLSAGKNAVFAWDGGNALVLLLAGCQLQLPCYSFVGACVLCLACTGVHLASPHCVRLQLVGYVYACGGAGRAHAREGTIQVVATCNPKTPASLWAFLTIDAARVCVDEGMLWIRRKVQGQPLKRNGSVCSFMSEE